MGCDYYRGTYLVIVYEDKEGNRQEEVVELERACGYFGESFDRDFMTVEDYFREKRKHYPNKDLFSKGKWVCLNDRATEYKKYTDKIEGQLVLVYKATDFMER